MRKHLLGVLIGGLLAPFPASAQIYNYFGPGNIQAGVTTGQSITTSRETSNSFQQIYGGNAYTVSGENIIANGPPGPGQTYTVMNNNGSPFQFSETWQPAGIVSNTFTGKQLDSSTITNSLSVFSQIGN
jgi:hypothetical protein